jgi:hypothetical protein
MNKKLKQLFSPSALAATVATGMLLHATVALAQQSCLSQCTSWSRPTNCNNVCGNGSQGYYCCPNAECASIVYGPNCANPSYGPQLVGWCSCP